MLEHSDGAMETQRLPRYSAPTSQQEHPEARQEANATALALLETPAPAEQTVQLKRTKHAQAQVQETPTPAEQTVQLKRKTQQAAPEEPVEQPAAPEEQAPSVPAELPTPLVLAPTVRAVEKDRAVRASKPKKASREEVNTRMVQERCRQLCLSLFFRENAPVRSLGFTSSVQGEGKTFLSLLTAQVLANDSSVPVTLVECNWENPSLQTHFGLSGTTGLAEWLRGECSETAIRHRVDHNLTLVPAGNGSGDAVHLLEHMRTKGVMNMLAKNNELLIIDLPSIVVSAYGTLAASLVESLVVVVRMGVTPDALVAETCAQLKDLPVHGLLLNQVESRIPRWLRQLL